MLTRVSLIILFISFISGCSNQGSEQLNEEHNSVLNTPVLAESNPGDISVVCSVLYHVDDFNSWLIEYNKIGHETIVILRNVDDPSLVIVFEGGQSKDMVEGRTSELVEADFLDAATVNGDHVVSYYDVQYMGSSEKEYKHYVALIFNTKDINQFLASLKKDLSHYVDYGLTPMGIGTNPSNPEQVYMLLTLEDFITFRKSTNSPRKINRFISSLNLPDETLILNWARADL
ncbi:MAG: hypothetical protein DRI71_10155 [Bacteroidetes bacterium]|nr:MAG: hypothetical protein DRI71_10155 [Bacteroidota bacterium]